MNVTYNLLSEERSPGGLAITTACAFDSRIKQWLVHCFFVGARETHNGRGGA